MIDSLFQITLNNSRIALGLAIMAATVGIILKRPVITHLLWLLVLLKLFTLPVITVPAIPILRINETNSPLNLNIDEQQNMQSLQVNESTENVYLPLETVSLGSIQGKTILFIAWILGSMVVLIWSMLQVYRFHRLLKKESETGSLAIQSIAKEIGFCLGIKTVPKIHTTSANIPPMVWWIGGRVWVMKLTLIPGIGSLIMLSPN